jgi:WD40 repeat protein
MPRPSCDLLLVADDHGCVHFIDMRRDMTTVKVMQVLDLDVEVLSLATHEKTETFAVMSPYEVRVFDVNTEMVLFEFSMAMADIFSSHLVSCKNNKTSHVVTFAPSGDKVIFTMRDIMGDTGSSIIMMADIVTGHTVLKIAAPFGVVGFDSVELSNDENLLITSAPGAYVSVWKLLADKDENTKKAERVRVIGGYAVPIIEKPDWDDGEEVINGHGFFTGNDTVCVFTAFRDNQDTCLVFVKVSTGDVLRNIEITHDTVRMVFPPKQCFPFAFVCDFTASICVSLPLSYEVQLEFVLHNADSVDGAFENIDPDEYDCVCTGGILSPDCKMTGHNGRVVDMAITSNGRFLVSCGEDNQVVVFDLRGKKRRCSVYLAGACKIAFMTNTMEPEKLAMGMMSAPRLGADAPGRGLGQLELSTIFGQMCQGGTTCRCV